MKALLDDSNLVIKLEESLLSTTVRRLRQEYLEALGQSPNPTSVTFDLSLAEMIDSQGLNFIISVFNDTQKNGISFRIVGVSQVNKKLFELVNLQEHVPVVF